MSVKARKSNYELLRIISMVLILMSHSDDIFGMVGLYSKSLGINKIIIDFLHIGGQIGVGCFILISGYFMVEKSITLKKLLRLAGEVWFYTIAIWLGWIIIRVSQGGIVFKDVAKETLYSFFPITLNHYWFVTAYILLMIISPFLNKLIYSFNYRNYRIFLITIIVIFIVLMGGLPHILPKMAEGQLTPMIVFYFIAGYLKRFRSEQKISAKKYLAIAAVSYILMFALCYFITYIGLKINNTFVLDNRYFYAALNSPFILLICFALFIGFKNINIRQNKIINVIASCVLGIYLIHDNRIIFDELAKVFPLYKETRPVYLLLCSIASIAIIYIVCTLIDLLRQATVEKLWLRFLDKRLGKVQNKVDGVIKSINQ